MKKIICIALTLAGIFGVLPQQLSAQKLSDSLYIENLESTAIQFLQSNNFDSALQYRLKLIEVATNSKTISALNRNTKLSSSLQSISRTYLTMGMPELAITYLNEQRHVVAGDDALSSYFKNRSDAMRMYAQAGLRNMDTANIYYDSLSVLCKKGNKKACYNQVALDLSFADYYTTVEDNKNALKYVTHANALAPAAADSMLQSQVRYITGNVYFKSGEYARAIPYMESALTSAEQWDQTLYVELLRNIAQCYGKLGDYRNAYKYYDLFAPLRDSIYVKGAQQSFAEMEASYQNKDKQQKLDVQSLQLKAAAKQRIFYIIGMILLAMVIASMIIIFLIRRKTNRLLHEKNEEMNILNENLEKANITKAKLFSIISHDLRNPISQVYQFLDLQKANPNAFSEADKVKHNERISAAAGVVLETMEDLLIWSKTQMQQFTKTVENINAQECVSTVAELLQTQSGKKNIVISNEIPNALQLSSDRNILMIILRNLLQNAITYSPEKSTIKISAERKIGSTRFTITDEGAGMPERIRRMFNEPSMDVNSSSSGLGLTIVKEMADILGAEIEITANKPSGTIISISIPETA